jgi:hypothetical protein
MKDKQELKEYDILECPVCDELCKPTSINKKGTVTYKHSCVNGSTSFEIDINGDLID